MSHPIPQIPMILLVLYREQPLFFWSTGFMAKVDPQTALGEKSTRFDYITLSFTFAPHPYSQPHQLYLWHKNVSSVLRIFRYFPPVKLSQTLLISSPQSGDLSCDWGLLVLDDAISWQRQVDNDDDVQGGGGLGRTLGGCGRLLPRLPGRMVEVAFPSSDDDQWLFVHYLCFHFKDFLTCRQWPVIEEVVLSKFSLYFILDLEID